MTHSPQKKRKRSSVSEKVIAPTPTNNVALPPPMVPYHFIPYPVYPHPYYFHPPISPRQSPTLNSSNNNPPRLLPKTTSYHPYQLSPPPQSSTADEREQARKISHSAIERRRRERINDKISQLKDLIPSCAERSNLHKMTVLQGAIDYIVYLRKVMKDLGKDPDALPVKPKVQEQEEEEEEEETWSEPSLVMTDTPVHNPIGLKPMDLLNQSKNPQETLSIKPSLSDRNMNLENLLCSDKVP